MLTALGLRALKPKEKRYEVADLPGLFLRVTPNGRMIWRINKSINGERVVRQLGEYPAMSLSEARKALQSLTDVTKTHTNDTFESVFAEWLELKKKSIKNWDDIENRMQKYILPHVGKLPLKVVTPQMLIKILRQDLEPQGKLETIKRICGIIKELEIYAVNCGITDVLRFQGINHVFAHPNTQLKSMPSIHPNQLLDILPKLHQSAIKAATTWDAIMIGFYTLLRPGEYTSIEWEWVDFDKKVINMPAEIMKMKKPHIVPVSTQLLKILEMRPKFNQFVLPSPDKRDQHVTTEAQSRFFRRHGLNNILVPHGIRSIGRTWMAEKRVDHDIAEMCLAHLTGSSVELAYNRTDLVEHRREVMQEWCDFVEDCLKGK